jgi:hypothetical protein
MARNRRPRAKRSRMHFTRGAGGLGKKGGRIRMGMVKGGPALPKVGRKGSRKSKRAM